MSDRLLLDTHALLWWKANDSRLNRSSREAIQSATVVFVSAASAWEIAIKSAIGRIRLPQALSDGVRESGFLELPVSFAHAQAVEILPAHHSDPFDRMLVAQTTVERLVFVTHDRAFESCGIPIIWT